MAIQNRKPVPKTQREISVSQHKAFDTSVGNPNNLTLTNRANQVSFKGDTTKPLSIGIQDIDESIFYYFDNVIRPFVYQNGDRIPVPVIYGAPEKWKSFQKDGYYRDKGGKIMLPIIMFKRDSLEKVRNISNKLDANFPNNFEVYQKPYSSRNAYDSFNVLNGVKPQKELYAVTMPDYVILNYSCVIATYYVDQLNKIIEAIEYASDSYWGNPERFKFRARIDSFATPVEVASNDVRSVRGTFNIKMYGYIIPDTVQKDTSAIDKFYSKSRISFTTETVSNINDIKS